MRKLNKNYFLFFANFLLSSLIYLVTLHDLDKWKEGIYYYFLFSLFCIFINNINPHLIKAQYIFALVLKMVSFFFILEVTPTVTLFFITLVVFDFVLLNSLFYELKESLFYSPDLSLISSPLKYLDCRLFIEGESIEVKLINFSENYIVLLSTKVIGKRGTEDRDRHLKINVSGSVFKIKLRLVFEKLNCNYFEIESSNTNRDGDWNLCYTELKKTKVLTRG